MPMRANVLLRTQGKNQLLVAATDLNVSLTAEPRVRMRQCRRRIGALGELTVDGAGFPSLSNV
jgi:hypothetical protein